MFDIKTGQFTFNNVWLWVDFILSIAIIAIVLIIMSRIIKNKSVLVIGLPLSIISVAAWFFGLNFLWIITIIILGTITVVLFFQKQRAFKESPLFSKKKTVTERVYDRNVVIQKVDAAVQSLSKTKTGALITFEKEDKFDEIAKSGTILNSPLSSELLLTIFYPGTRLHDGAVVIRKDEILAASVYYTPTTKPLTGKYGSRHRAAIGVSDTTDSITVVVSEETGRISIASKGELTTVAPEKFSKTLLNFLTEEE